MTWVKKDDAQPLHPKFLRLSDGAYRLWDHAVSFSNRTASNGVITKEMLPTLNHHGRWTARQIAGFAAELVTVPQGYESPLWVEHSEHYEIHDYEHYQAEAMKERVERLKEYERDKKRRQRGGSDRKKYGVPAGHEGGQLAGLPTGSRPEISVPSRPVPSRPEESASHSPGAGEASPSDSGAVHVPRPAWEAAMRGPDALTVACLAAFDAGYASSGRAALGVRSKHADLGSLVADAQGLGDPVEIFRRAGAALAAQVIASKGTEHPIRHPWRMFCSAPIGSWLDGADSSHVLPSSGEATAPDGSQVIREIEVRFRAAQARALELAGEDGVTEARELVREIQRELVTAKTRAA